MSIRLYAAGAGSEAFERAVTRIGALLAELDAGQEASACDCAVAVVALPLGAAARELRSRAVTHARLLVVLLSAEAVSVEDRLALLEIGASDVVIWNEEADSLRAVRARLLRWHTIERLLGHDLLRKNLIGGSPAWREVLRQVVEIAYFTTTSVLLTGESGTGKELVARLVHALDTRPGKGDLVVLDCGTIVAELSGSEFFGHERGAFTGAGQARVGAFQLAHRGTLFLDEVGELPLPLQAQLLRVLQEKTFKPVGSNAWQKTEFRLVCATHRDLAERVRRGEFRHDLYHRIATWPLRLPALRERRDDILPLARHMAGPAGDGPALEFDAAVERYLVQRDYPGNVRELGHVVQRLMDRYPGVGPLTLGQIPDEERRTLAPQQPAWPDQGLEGPILQALALGISLKAIGRTAEEHAVRAALRLENGNVARASRRLGITDRALQLRQAARRRESAPSTPSGEPGAEPDR